MKIAYTVCSANYLPFAKSLADSFIQHNPGYQFVIALADTFRDYDTGFFSPHLVIPVEEMQISGLEEMNAKYSIFELTCALKPFVAEYLFNKYPQSSIVFYFDSDILVFNPLTVAETVLEHHSIALTPHISKPQLITISVNTELDVLRTGLYNAGFFGLKRSGSTTIFLNWWKERLREYCFNDAAHGLFVDQLWLDLVPVYFRDTCIIYDAGYNLAYWNLSERSLSGKEGDYQVDDTCPLVFFHYSGYAIENPGMISKYQKTISFDSHPQLKPLFDNFFSAVKKNDVHYFLSLPTTMGKPAFVQPVDTVVDKKTLKQKLKKFFNRTN